MILVWKLGEGVLTDKAMKKLLFKWLFIVFLIMIGSTLSWAGSGDPVVEDKNISGSLIFDTGAGQQWNMYLDSGTFNIKDNTNTKYPFLIETNSPSNSLRISPNGISVGTGTANEKLTVEGAISLDEIVAPSLTAGYGKVYVKATDSLLYFKDDSGTEYGLTSGISDKIIEGDTSVEVVDTGDGYIVFTEDGSEVGRFSNTNFNLGSGGDPADAGAIRLKNADKIVWEASPAGTDVEGISVDSSEIVQIGAAGASGVTITPALTGSTGTFTGTLSGELGVTLDTSATIDLSTASNARGAVRINNDNDVIDYTLPPAEAGLNICFYSRYAAVMTIDCDDGADTIVLKGTALTAGNAIDSAGGAGDFVCLLCIDATYWLTLGMSGTFIDGGAD